MKMNIIGKNMEVSDYLKGVVEKKVSKLARYLRPETEVNAVLSMLRGRHVVEVTIPFGDIVLRGEETTGDMYASVDNVLKKLEKQIIKHRTRLGRKFREEAFTKETTEYGEEYKNIESEAQPRVVRTKRFAIKPMTLDEAVMQYELLGHSFFVFRNAGTGEVNVLYRREDGELGLIEPEID
ncbi:MAG: ribosome-associated translation inhibitor RaiA [Bacillota bacterium]|nr:ribosome-associated translation inhibitor RaiA [Bacillota bacterium]